MEFGIFGWAHVDRKPVALRHLEAPPDLWDPDYLRAQVELLEKAHAELQNFLETELEKLPTCSKGAIVLAGLAENDEHTYQTEKRELLGRLKEVLGEWRCAWEFGFWGEKV